MQYHTQKIDSNYYGWNDTSVTQKTNLLTNCNYDFTKLPNNNKYMSLCNSSNVDTLANLIVIYGIHNLCPFFKGLHKNRIKHIFPQELTECERLEKLHVNLSQGNHNSATVQPKELATKLFREVASKFAVLVWVSVIQKILGAMVQAYRPVAEYTILDTRNRKEKT